MKDSDDIPTIEEIRSALRTPRTPEHQVVTQDEDRSRVTTDYENGVQLMRSLGDVVQFSSAADDN